MRPVGQAGMTAVLEAAPAQRPAGWLSRLRDGGWLTPRRAAGWAAVLLICELAGLAFGAAGTHGLIVPLERPVSTDFVSFYAAGRLADAGTGWLAYDRTAHYVAEQMATAFGVPYNYFFYPPTFLLICAPFALLPYLVGFGAFQVAGLGACLVAARRIVPGVPLVVLAAFPAVFWTLGTGQNAGLTAALFAAATLLVDRRPVLAGLLFGALCYKPHFGLLIPVALLAAGNWRALAGAAAAVLAMVGLSIAVFGWATWAAFLHAMAGSGSVYGGHAIDLAGLTSPYGAVLVLGGSVWQAGIVQACASAGSAVLVGWVWRRQPSLPVRAGVLLAAVPVATPICLFYDLMLDGVAIAWLVAAGRRFGFPPWTRTLLLAGFALPLVSGNLAGTTHWLIAPAAALSVLLAAALTARQAAVIPT
jgi:hypothetical protein